jgi:hypothetical protein
MPKLLCDCGQILPYGEIPNPIEWMMISDVEYSKFSGTIGAEELYKASTSLLQCPRCSRLWVFWKGFTEAPQAYIPQKMYADSA